MSDVEPISNGTDTPSEGVAGGVSKREIEQLRLIEENEAALEEEELIAGVSEQSPVLVPQKAEGGGAVSPQEEVPAEDEIAVLISAAESISTQVPGARAATPPAASPPVSDAVIDALVAAAGPVAEPVSLENLAAAASAPEAGLGGRMPTQDDLEALIEAAREAAKPEGATVSTDSAGTLPLEVVLPMARPTRSRLPWARIGVSLLAGVLVGGGVYVLLNLIAEERAGIARVIEGSKGAVELALERARQQLTLDRPEAASAIVAPLVEGGAAVPDRASAEILDLEARYRAYMKEPRPEVLTDLHAAIDRIAEKYKDHPRLPELLCWKAKLYESDGLPFAAMDLLLGVAGHFPQYGARDAVLAEAARLALQQKDAARALEIAETILREYPASPHALEAALLSGDAHAQLGDSAAAEAAYAAAAAHGGDAAVEASFRRGKSAFAAGDYPEAIRALDAYIGATTRPGKADEAYLLLAQSYLRAGQADAARDTAQTMIKVFEGSALLPEAYAVQARALDALGDRAAALRVAREAAARYPENVSALKTAAEFHGLTGNPIEAAQALVAADRAGAGEASVLLTAARHFNAAGMAEEARKTYQRVEDKYTGLPEAFIAAIERAQMQAHAGDSLGALKTLDRVIIASAGTPQYEDALLAKIALCEASGLRDPLAEAARALIATGPSAEYRARAVQGLLSAGDLSAAQEALATLDLGRLRPAQASALLVQFGRALRAVDPRRALETMEQAYLSYPAARTAESLGLLLEAYLAAGRPAAARRIALELEDLARQDSAYLPQVVDGQIAYGDYLFARGDYRAAADAYDRAMQAAAQLKEGASAAGSRDPAWAQFQRANALLELSDYAGCLPIFDEIAKAGGRWSADAAAKAAQARLEMRLQGRSS
jgi:TolA-binding protein